MSVGPGVLGPGVGHGALKGLVRGWGLGVRVGSTRVLVEGWAMAMVLEYWWESGV